MRQYIAYALALGIVWCFVSGEASILNFMVGSVLGILIIWSLRKLYQPDEEVPYKNILARIPKIATFFAILTIEITKASILIAKIVLWPKLDIKPGIIAVPIRATKDVSITAIANTISLTPGTITIDVSDDLTKIYVHSIDASDPEALKVSIRDKLEKYVLEAFE
ncbi:MAG: Na+/H+ antiporter subunit E [Methanolobus sp.]|uniref:Na+/H+ antiporter subunit E n=1 Tax=Methanolobus sp. TaxID=1874737 RepID=UPI00273163F8|nr:Na+/H+ antiporter subunit E [Methanolobus sp.]MDP2218232.1 Na+/H+ antiporter subunit E [Methanolobus sp.]